jgi:two-component system, OmpR family, response regulator RpaA
MPGDHLTTGQVARLCGVAPRTVSKWFDSGKLPGFRVPGSRDRRIPRAAFRAFLTANALPIDAFEQFEAAEATDAPVVL